MIWDKKYRPLKLEELEGSIIEYRLPAGLKELVNEIREKGLRITIRDLYKLLGEEKPSISLPKEYFEEPYGRVAISEERPFKDYDLFGGYSAFLRRIAGIMDALKKGKLELKLKKKDGIKKIYKSYFSKVE